MKKPPESPDTPSPEEIKRRENTIQEQLERIRLIVRCMQAISPWTDVHPPITDLVENIRMAEAFISTAEDRVVAGIIGAFATLVCNSASPMELSSIAEQMWIAHEELYKKKINEPENDN